MSKHDRCCIYWPKDERACVACRECGAALPGCRMAYPYPLRCNTKACQMGGKVPAFVNGPTRGRVWGIMMLGNTLTQVERQHYSALMERAYLDEYEADLSMRLNAHLLYGDEGAAYGGTGGARPPRPPATPENLIGSALQWLGTNVGRCYATSQVPKRFELYNRLYGEGASPFLFPGCTQAEIDCWKRDHP